MFQTQPPCLQCGGGIVATITKTGKQSLHQKKYCSKSCQWKAKRIKDKTLGKHYVGVASGVCKGCLQPFTRNKISNRDYGTYCSKQCALSGVRGKRTKQLKLQQQEEAARLRKEAQHLRAYVEMLGRLFRKQHRPITTNKSCRDCGVEFTAKYKTPMIRCDHCQENKTKSDKKKAQRVSKAVRRARMRTTQVVSIDPLKVFNRDKWKCKQCLVSTPQSLRGTHHDNAPELDHIITLAEGGSHTWGNVQCLCRKCNQLKSSVSFGQLGLEIAC